VGWQCNHLPASILAPSRVCYRSVCARVVRGVVLTFCSAAAFIDASLFSKYAYTPTTLLDIVQEDEETQDVLLQLNLHALLECLAMFSVGTTFTPGSGLQRAAELQRGAFQLVKGTMRFIYEGDGEPFLIVHVSALSRRVCGPSGCVVDVPC
jgi:hypothetical protein